MKAHTHRACLLLGSNIQPERNLPLAVERLQDWVSVLQASSVWETPPVGTPGPDFLNVALLVSTRLEQDDLKNQVIHPLEAQMGRVRTQDKNAPRPIDIDIITFDRRLVDASLWQHAHRAVPVAEIFPDYRSEMGEKLAEAARRMSAGTRMRLRPDVPIRLQPHAV